MPENVRQDVKTQSHRIHFTYDGSKYDFFYLVGLEYYLLKYNGFQSARSYPPSQHRVYYHLYNLHHER